VAVKVLRRDQFPTNEDFEEAVHLEAQVLRAMRSMEDRHLIQTIACYRKDPNDCFVFPWADHGNLRNYWENSNLTITGRLAPTYLIWVFTQLRGLAHAITLLHEDIIRHGDLKPENILCFRDSTEENVENQCVLVIADAGLAKINYQATQLRNGASIGPKGSTLMYEPPEAEVGGNNPISRRYDVSSGSSRAGRAWSSLAKT
jgi:serine/threonine protein kinase